MMFIVGLIVCLLHTFTSSDAAFTWIRSDASVDFIQGKTAKLVWTVDVGSPYKWFKVFIYRNKEKSESGEEKIIELLESNGVKTKHLSGREADIDLVVQGTSNVVNVTFTLHNLVQTTDEKYYRIDVVNSNFVSKSEYTFLRVLVLPGTPVLQLHPNNPVFCQGNTINITCNGLTGNPTLTNVAFLQNDSTIGMLNVTTSGNYTKTVLSHALNQPGPLKFSCKATNAAGSSPTSNVVTITVKDPPVITSCTNKTIVENDNLVWTCDVSGSQPLTISWFNTTTVIQSGNSLKIAAVSRADDGMYRFTASNGGECSTASKTVNLDVQYKPEQIIVNMAQNGFIDINEGQSNVDITCSAKGNPEPYYHWVFDGKPLSSLRNDTITISNAAKGNAGKYTCTAVNTVGNETIAVTVRVHYIEDATCDAKPNPVKENENVTLSCSAAGYPAVNYTWTLPGSNVSQQNTTVKANPSLNGVSITCNAMNSRGSRTCTKTITVHYKPRNVQVVPASVPALNINVSFNLTCNASSNPDGSYTWSKNGVTLVGKTNRVLTKDNITPQDAGEYTCTVTNSEGNGTSNKVTINVNFIGNATCDAKPNPVKENENVTLSCSAPGYPAVSYTWALPGSDVSHQNTTVKANTSLNGVSMTCKAMNSHGSKICTKTITVHYKPRNVQVVPSSVPALDINGSISLTCNASSNPDGSYTWSKNGVLLAGETNRVLTKDNITLQDAGEYTCTVTNSEGSGASNKVTININYKPKIQKCAPVRYLYENSSHVFHCNKADGFPAPSYTALYNGTNYNESVTIDRVTKALNGSVIRCSASNSLGSHSCNTTLIVGFLNLGICNNTLGLPTNVKLGLQLVGNPVGNPVPTLYCSSNSVKQINGSYFEILPTNKTGVSTCTLANNVTGCNFTVKVYKQVEAYIQEYRFRCSSCKWNQTLGDNKTEEFTRYKKIWEDILTRIYRNNKYVTKITVIGFWRGSVNVNFALTLIAIVSDPLSPLKEEVQRNNGSVDGFAMDSIQSGLYVPQTTTKKPIITTTSTPKPIATPTPFPVEAIIGISVGCALLLILVIILLVYCCYFKKRRDSKSEEHTFAEDGGNAVPMAARGIYNRGSSPSPSTYAKHGPGANGNNNVGNGDTVYAQEDKSKKTKKPAGSNEGEVTYAVLDDGRGDNKSGDTQLAHMPSSGQVPEKHERHYAEIKGSIRSSETPKENESADNSNKNGEKPENAEKESEAEEQAKDKNQDGSPSTSQTVDNAVKNDNASGSQINVETKGTSSSAPQYGKESEETFTKL